MCVCVCVCVCLLCWIEQLIDTLFGWNFFVDVVVVVMVVMGVKRE